MTVDTTHTAAQASLHLLVGRARETLQRNSRELVKVAAAVLARDGNIFTGVQVRSSNCSHCSVCAEPVAIGAALTAGATDLVACVAVARRSDGDAIWSPCGSCRELMRDHRINQIIVAQAPDGEPIIASPADLLPWP